MGTLICRANIGESRDQGVFSGKLCKNEIGNLAVAGKALLRVAVKELGFFCRCCGKCIMLLPSASLPVHLCLNATVKFRNVLNAQ